MSTSQPEQKEPTPAEADNVQVTLSLDKPTSVLLNDCNLYVLAIPLAMPKETALGIMFNELCEFRGLYNKLALMAKQRKPGLIRAGAQAIRNLIKP